MRFVIYTAFPGVKEHAKWSLILVSVGINILVFFFIKQYNLSVNSPITTKFSSFEFKEVKPVSCSEKNLVSCRVAWECCSSLS